MIEINSRYALRYFVPARDEEKMVLGKFPGGTAQVFVWDGEWVQKVYWRMDETERVIGATREEIHFMLREFKDLFPFKFRNKKIVFTYTQVLKLNFMIKEARKGQLSRHIESGKLVKLYHANKEHHVI